MKSNLGSIRGEHFRHKAAIEIASLLAIVLVLSGCGPEVWKWTEEAKLDNGKKVVVEREVIFGGARLPWERNRLQSEYVLRFAAPDNPATRYEYRSIGGLSPSLVAFVNGTPYVLGQADRGDAVMYYDCPDPSFVIHRYDKGRWKRAELRDLPATIKKKNLAIFGNEAMANAKAGGLASAEQIAEWNDSSFRGNRQTGRYAGTPAAEIPRPPDGAVRYDCKAIGETRMSEEWRADFRTRYVPPITE